MCGSSSGGGLRPRSSPALVPSAEQTELLAACLHGGERAREAWARWLHGRDTDDAGVCRDLASTRTLLPLLARATIAGAGSLSPGVGAYLRAATLREELRAERVRTIAAEVLDALREAEAAPLVVRGPALAATVYDDWSLRHCHDLDLLVGREGLPRDGRAAPRRLRRARRECWRMCCWTIPRRLGIALHTRPFAFAYYDGSGWSDWGSEEIVVAGISARATSPEATLVHVLGHAGYSASQRNLRWVANAWHLVLRCELDWTVFVELVEVHRLELPVSALLRYLIDFGVPVPPDVGARLRGVGRPRRARGRGRRARRGARGGAGRARAPLAVERLAQRADPARPVGRRTVGGVRPQHVSGLPRVARPAGVRIPARPIRRRQDRPPAPRVARRSYAAGGDGPPRSADDCRNASRSTSPRA